MTDPTTPDPNAHPAARDPAAQDDRATKTRAEFCLKLADRAWDRNKYNKTVDWRAAFGIWSAFAAGAGFVLTAASVPVNVWPAILGTVFALLALGLFGGLWLPYSRHSTHDETKRAIEWEEETIRLLELKPDPVRANPDAHVCCGLHKAQWMQLAVSVLFALLFIGALWMRWAASVSSDNHPSTVTVDNGSLDIDSPSTKLHLGKQ